jgi:hypothetical protein
MEIKHLIALTILIAFSLSLYIHISSSTINIVNEHGKSFTMSGDYDKVQIVRSSGVKLTVYGHVGKIVVRDCRDVTVEVYGYDDREIINCYNVKIVKIAPMRTEKPVQPKPVQPMKPVQKPQTVKPVVTVKPKVQPVATPITTTPTPIVTPTPYSVGPYQYNTYPSYFYIPKRGYPGGVLLNVYYTLNSSVEMKNIGGDILSKEIFPDKHSARTCIAGYIQTVKTIELVIEDKRPDLHSVKVTVKAPPGVEVGLSSDEDEVIYVTKNVWVVKSNDNIIRLKQSVYALPTAMGERTMYVNVDAV